MERGAAPAGWSRQIQHPGGAGAPPGDTKVPCQELADRRSANAPVKSGARCRKENAASEPEVKQPPVARRTAPRSSQGERALKTKGSAARRAIPSPSRAKGKPKAPRSARGR